MTEAEIIKQLKIEKIKAMKNPNILMNTTDFENLKKHVESTVENFKIGDPPTFNGFPITLRDYMQEGKVFIIDIPIPKLQNDINLKSHLHTIDIQKVIDFLKTSKKQHYYCEDTYYNCNAHPDEPGNDQGASHGECTCGADNYNVELEIHIQILEKVKSDL